MWLGASMILFAGFDGIFEAICPTPVHTSEK